MMRNRREEDANYVEDENDKDFHKHNDSKPYPYLLLFKYFIYSLFGSACVALFFIFFILKADHHEVNNAVSLRLDVPSSQTQNHTKKIHETHRLREHEPVDKCADEWTSDKLIGRCFGLKAHSEYEALKDIPSVDNSVVCRNMCCTIGEQCKTWQFWSDNKICKLGGLVRVGTESLNTPNWCDSEAPVVWSGKRIESKNNINAQVGADLTTQCFGLGPLRTNENKVSLDKEECIAQCLATVDCKVWQWHEKRGCYYTNNPQVYCDPYSGGYEGGRKKNSQMQS